MWHVDRPPCRGYFRRRRGGRRPSRLLPAATGSPIGVGRLPRHGRSTPVVSTLGGHSGPSPPASLRRAYVLRYHFYPIRNMLTSRNCFVDRIGRWSRRVLLFHLHRPAPPGHPLKPLDVLSAAWTQCVSSQRYLTTGTARGPAS